MSEERESIGRDDVFHAFVDESTSCDLGITCSAGYLFEAAGSREFCKVWKPFLKSKGIQDSFHATRDIRHSDAQEIFLTLTSLIKRTAYRGFVNFLHTSALKSVHKSIRPYLGSGFSVSTLGCIAMMADAAHEESKSIDYVIENGNRFDGELRHFLNQIKANKSMRDRYAIVRACTADKRNVVQLHAADLFAWSFTRSH